ncbi:hypothetical protein TYRP_011308 [Tyrophagus putrescentiae]|nr:hypothetical protein TYRP_011308 [Tyrophagus putrescentiae]
MATVVVEFVHSSGDSQLASCCARRPSPVSPAALDLLQSSLPISAGQENCHICHPPAQPIGADQPTPAEVLRHQTTTITITSNNQVHHNRACQPATVDYI